MALSNARLCLYMVCSVIFWVTRMLSFPNFFSVTSPIGTQKSIQVLGILWANSTAVCFRVANIMSAYPLWHGPECDYKVVMFWGWSGWKGGNMTPRIKRVVLSDATVGIFYIMGTYAFPWPYASPENSFQVTKQQGDSWSTLAIILYFSYSRFESRCSRLNKKIYLECFNMDTWNGYWTDQCNGEIKIIYSSNMVRIIKSSLLLSCIKYFL